jgi:anthranilate phosphoribosyltransferase
VIARILEDLTGGVKLDRARSRELFSAIVSGRLSDIEIAAVLAALKVSGETADEIAGAAMALRANARAAALFSGIETADSCGTGGDASSSLNISTAAALVAAAAGVRVAKHGNRSVSSRCGSADVLEACGVRIDAPPEVSLRCLKELGICFLFAPLYHPGVKNAMAARKALGTRTIFNVLGPLCNPAAPRFQVIGVYSRDLVRVVAEAFCALGGGAALIVHGSGLDEIAVHGRTECVLARGGELEDLAIEPEDAGVRRRPLGDLAGGDAAGNAKRLRTVLEGRDGGAHGDAVAINAGALLWICGRAGDLKAGTALAQGVMKSGAAATLLSRWAEMSNVP